MTADPTANGIQVEGTGAIGRVLVVIPARDEEALIGRALEAVGRARAALRGACPDVAVDVVVVADASTDATAATAAGFEGVRVLESTAGRVGAARAHGIRVLLGGVGPVPAPESIWIANTDADSVVPERWLADQVSMADRGVDVMVGTVRPDPDDLTDEQNAAWLETHVLGRPNGHVHGANLGLRASAYLAAGGFDPVDEHEDNRLVDRLRRGPWVIAASDVCQVVTSGRRVGRTPGGYAGYLAETL